jgi:exodeoxyribonuclease VII large subunit
MQAVDGLARRLVHPAERLRALRQNLLHLGKRLSSATARLFERFTAQVNVAHKSIASLDPTAVLGRGYSITRSAGGALLRDASKVSAGERIVTTLAKGTIESEVKSKA